MLQMRPAAERGQANHGWLNSQHTFSFADYFNPREVGFSDLRVINDDRVAPSQGFGQHPHRDMEIFSYVLDGQLEHRDSMGTGGVIKPGDVQLMSAGKGVIHSEFNHSSTEQVHFLQIWLLPDALGYEPRYQQQHFSNADKRGQLKMIIGPESETSAPLKIRQDARIYAGLFDGEESAELPLGQHRYAYVHVARGSLSVNGQHLSEGDGARLRNEDTITLSEGDDAEVLVFDLRNEELPQMPSTRAQ